MSRARVKIVLTKIRSSYRLGFVINDWYRIQGVRLQIMGKLASLPFISLEASVLMI